MKISGCGVVVLSNEVFATSTMLILLSLRVKIMLSALTFSRLSEVSFEKNMDLPLLKLCPYVSNL